ncbi:sirohydrochlorin nickelochelatase [uncultured Methanobacterium sp.]|uniref:sirohydrochlorin nickelochelatase n=1 Tax=uncultured Methanobacterium sp. TaxID=176306 RepID=UPI002AA777B8|nr:sirohydrochlorin nickelochelatase [uncultured Methanobacterium sp.]
MNTESNSNEKIGILLIGHGSSLSQSNDVIHKLSAMYKETSPYPVEVGFMNIEKPSIPTALNTLAGKGVDRIIAAPIFLAHGLHTKEDIPYMLGLGEARKDAGYYNQEQDPIEFDGEIVYIEPMGADPRIVDVIKKRVEESLG